jgi:hypothetical protein
MLLSIIFLTKLSQGVAKTMSTMRVMTPEISGNITERRLSDVKVSGGFACARSCIIILADMDFDLCLRCQPVYDCQVLMKGVLAVCGP